MTDTLLRSLRERLLDETEPLAGLLRVCLLLGAETGSDTLRAWARSELNGYGKDVEVPEYRRISNPPISMDSISGYTHSKNQIISKLQLPHDSWEYIPDEMWLKQPIEELEQLAKQERLSFGSPGLAMALTIWNRQLDEFQQVISLSYAMTGSVIAGVLGQIRTNLVDVVADLTADTPLSELPKKGQVDAAMSHHMGDIYNTNIRTSNGPVAIGAKAKATTEGLTVEDAIRLLDKVREAAAEVPDEHRAEVLGAVDELRTAVQDDDSDTGEVVKKAGKLRAAAEKVGAAGLTMAASSAVQAVTDLAISGVFG
ncbi:hypothetical protein [Actinoplanes sp. HUAS TT8]|uniref:AbiTii domain-containing protein n=1 Tax=Actinoplanes sp. HUAS TT8 TaxID=3447453 RepID=UPI003F528FD4